MAGPLAAQAFVLHAEGDENNSETAQTMLNTLGILAAQQFPDLNSTMQSALSDISNYGTERADQTPDRTLTIDLPCSQAASAHCVRTALTRMDSIPCRVSGQPSL